MPLRPLLGCIWLLLFAWQAPLVSASGPEAKKVELAELREKLAQALPKGWVVEDRISWLEILGPEVPALWPISLPGSASDEAIWREFANPLKIRLAIRFQERLPDKDLAELRNMRDRFEAITEQAANRRLKGWDETIKDYGYIRLPDFHSETAAIFVDSNTRGFLIKQQDALAALALIEKELAAKFSRVPEK